MIDSIFDPGGSETEHSGSRFTGPRAENNSRMPADQVDGKVSEEEVADIEGLARPDDVADQPMKETVKDLNPDYSGDEIWQPKENEV